MSCRIPGMCPLFKHGCSCAHWACVNIQWRQSAFIRTKDREMPELLRLGKGKLYLFTCWKSSCHHLISDSDCTWIWIIFVKKSRWCAQHASALGWPWQASMTPGSIRLFEAHCSPGTVVACGSGRCFVDNSIDKWLTDRPNREIWIDIVRHE
jgi:hypothetical protein